MLILVSSCAAPPMQVNLPSFSPSLTSEVIELSNIEIVNKANDGELVNTTVFNNSILPLHLATTTKETVENDIQEYLKKHTRINKSAERSLRVIITRADSYWVWSSADKIPFVGLLLIGTDSEFGINLRVVFEIEQKGKVVSSYWFDKKITIESVSATEETIKESYKKLITEYRKVFFDELNSSFINRYL